ncbi:hypothetical protein DWX58_07915 [Pseudoflavonifractor sp. AF19-9AC]|uniref:hypothetical protein n=1 Tax=Pseudoflavonifractor sp. AF19-9AC TaxID=2292244 RepID=UPI000E4EF2E5|nr:hypothetical protein [Pseudoflavonifractor sp. AF19-9AC]RHR08847.1 hypothetical protein DWX58_07915 [Pseudoflavonifractor sp. AF19-9AC]
MENTNMTTSMCAVVLCVQSSSLMVCDCSTQQKVLVHTDQACCFSCDDRVRIVYSGMMSMSLPPQITALCISRMCG